MPFRKRLLHELVEPSKALKFGPQRKVLSYLPSADDTDPHQESAQLMAE
jgi:hypothetical protein